MTERNPALLSDLDGSWPFSHQPNKSRASQTQNILDLYNNFGVMKDAKASAFSNAINMERLAAPADLRHLPTIRYAYDPIPGVSDHSIHPFAIPNSAKETSLSASANAIKLDPLAAGIPYCSNIDHVYVSKHWKEILEETKHMLTLLSNDDAASKKVSDDEITLASLASKELELGVENGIALAAQFMFPSANPQRPKLIGALMLLYFVLEFDGQSISPETIHHY